MALIPVTRAETRILAGHGPLVTVTAEELRHPSSYQS
jgi:hypothetical protein